MKDFVPRPWQLPAIDHILKHKRCALWLPMGSGKTSIVLTALDILSLTEGDVWPALAIGPLRVARKVWREEVAKWTHTSGIRVRQIIGTAKERMAALNGEAELFVINYENIVWFLKQFEKHPWPFKTIIPDESRKLKAYRIKQGGVMTAALAKVAWKSERFIELTGTPSPLGLQDLWGQLWFLDQGKRLGRTYSEFDHRWFGYKRVRDALSKSPSIVAVIQKGADEEIHERVKDLCLSIDLKDYLDIKKPVQRSVMIELPAHARKLYNQMERELFIKIEQHEIEAFSAASKTIKLMQIANGACYLDEDVMNDDDPRARAWKTVHDAKINALESVVDEAGGTPVLVAYQFKSDLARLLKAFPKGRQLKTEKDEDDFKAGLIPMLFAHPKSAGHGIDGFQNVTSVIAFFGHSWDLELRQQMIERIGPTRQMQSGFDRLVFVYDIVAEDTIDEVVLARHESKRAVQDLLLDAVKAKAYATL